MERITLTLPMKIIEWSCVKFQILNKIILAHGYMCDERIYDIIVTRYNTQ